MEPVRSLLLTRRFAAALATVGGAVLVIAAVPARGAKLRLQFWHTRRGAQEKLLQELCAAYNRTSAAAEVVPQYQGGYNDLNTKIRASIQARSLPDLAVAYENQVAEYMANGVIRPLDDLVAHPQLGLGKGGLADVPKPYVEANRYLEFGNRLLSFPFTKSHLVLYYNRTLLQRAGFKAPPVTWDEFEKQSAQLTRVIGKPAVAFDLDPSTLDGLIYAFGGRPLSPDGKRALFDQPPAVNALALLARMKQAGTLKQIEGTDQGALFSSQSCAFAFSTSAARAEVEQLVGRRFDWDVAVPPHAPGVKPVTVMYGPNVCIFKSKPAQEAEAWKFVRYFISPAVTARWSRETGYLPVRSSAVRLPEMKQFYAADPRAWHVYQILPFARSEPTALGWQEIRGYLRDAAQSVLSRGTPARTACVDLKQKADRVLVQSR